MFTQCQLKLTLEARMSIYHPKKHVFVGKKSIRAHNIALNTDEKRILLDVRYYVEQLNI